MRTATTAATLVRVVRILGLWLMGLGLLMLVGYAVRPLLSVIRALLPDLLLLLPWPLLVGLGAATLGAVILLTTLVARRMARRTYDNNLKKS